MTRITFIQPHLRFGGAERQTVLVANRLVSEGHEVHLILHQAGQGLASELREDVIVHDLNLESHFATFAVASRLRRALSTIGPSLVIVKLWSSILACALIDSRSNVRHHVYNYCEDLDPTDHAEYIRLGKLKQWLVGRIFNHRKYLSANTNTVADSMVDVYRLSQRPVIIPSTVDVENTDRLGGVDAIDFGDGRHVVSVSSLIRRKGLDITRDALMKINHPITWHVVGEGPLREELDGFVDPRGLLKIVTHGGHSNPYRFMAAADLMIHSARSEAWGIVLLESMAVGTPVLAADSIGPHEMHDALGDRPDILRTYPVGDVEALAAQVTEMLESTPAKKADMQEYVAPFSLERATKIWISRAEELLGQ